MGVEVVAFMVSEDGSMRGPPEEGWPNVVGLRVHQVEKNVAAVVKGENAEVEKKVRRSLFVVVIVVCGVFITLLPLLFPEKVASFNEFPIG